MINFYCNNKSYKIELEDIIFVLFSFICLSAGTGWGYLYRDYATYLIGILSVVEVIINNRMRKTHELHYYLVILCLFFLSFVFSYSRMESFRFFCIYLSIGAFLYYSFEDSFILRFLKILEIVTVIVAISIVVSSIIPLAFASVAGVVIHSDMTNFLIRVNSGQYSGLAGEIAEAAVLMNYGIATVIGKILSGRIKLYYVIELVLFYLGLFLTTKRTLTLVAFIIPVLFFVITKMESQVRIKRLFLLIAFICIGVLILINVPSMNTVIERFILLKEDTDNGGREAFWMYSLLMFEDAPVFGKGFGVFNTYFNSNGGNALINQDWSYYGHNIYLETLGEIGIVGCLIFFYPITKSLILGIKNILFDKICKPELFFLVYIDIMYAVYGYSGNPIYYVQQVFLWMFSIYYILNENSKLKKGKFEKK